MRDKRKCSYLPIPTGPCILWNGYPSVGVYHRRNSRNVHALIRNIHSSQGAIAEMQLSSATRNIHRLQIAISEKCSYLPYTDWAEYPPCSYPLVSGPIPTAPGAGGYPLRMIIHTVGISDSIAPYPVGWRIGRIDRIIGFPRA